MPDTPRDLSSVPGLHIRPARPGDEALVVSMIRELAGYERLRSSCHADPERLAHHLFGPEPCAEVLLAEVRGEPAAFALYFRTFSTFACAPSLYLEDLFVRPAHRRQGIGRALLTCLARRAVDRGCRRVEWAVLDWNRPALDFYRGLGARPQDDWILYRLDGVALERLAGT